MEQLRNRAWFRRHFPRGERRRERLSPFRHQTVVLTLSARTQYLRIKRAVQAAFNTEASYLSAKMSQVQAGGQAADEAVHGGEDHAAAGGDPMAALEAQAAAAVQRGGTTVGGFVKASDESAQIKGNQQAAVDAAANKDEIGIDDDDDDDDE